MSNYEEIVIDGNRFALVPEFDGKFDYDNYSTWGAPYGMKWTSLYGMEKVWMLCAGLNTVAVITMFQPTVDRVSWQFVSNVTIGTFRSLENCVYAVNRMIEGRGK